MYRLQLFQDNQIIADAPLADLRMDEFNVNCKVNIDSEGQMDLTPVFSFWNCTSKELYVSRDETISISVFADRPYLLIGGISFLAICGAIFISERKSTKELYARALAKIRMEEKKL
jgi:hypothetical protein